MLQIWNILLSFISCFFSAKAKKKDFVFFRFADSKSDSRFSDRGSSRHKKVTNSSYFLSLFFGISENPFLFARPFVKQIFLLFWLLKWLQFLCTFIRCTALNNAHRVEQFCLHVKHVFVITVKVISRVLWFENSHLVNDYLIKIIS